MPERPGSPGSAEAPRAWPDAWPDAWLVRATRRDPPDGAALDVLVQRHWAALHARCELLTLDREAARDLAQDTWVRVLRARRTLDPQASFPAFLATIATNLWRDRLRAARRAGPLGEHRTVSLDAAVPSADDEPLALADALAVPDAEWLDELAARRVDVDRALARLSPRARDLLVARYLDGESAAEIGQRYGRTEQAVTGWLRQAIAEVRAQLGRPRAADAPGAER